MRSDHRGGWPPLPVVIVGAAFLLWGVRLALVGVAGLAGWEHLLRDFRRDLERTWAEVLEHFLTHTGTSVLWTLGGALCLVALLGLWTRRSWGRGLARTLLLLALLWHVLDVAMILERSLPEVLEGLLALVYAVALLAVVHDPAAGRWLSGRGDGPHAERILAQGPPDPAPRRARGPDQSNARGL